MPYSSYPLDAFLIIDNSALVNLCEYYFDTHIDLPFEDMVQAACLEISDCFAILRGFSFDGKIHTTPWVLDEFKPEHGELSEYSGFEYKLCEPLKIKIRDELEQSDINMRAVERLRTLRLAHPRFGDELSRLSNPDLSLVILAMEIAGKTNQRVYILTDDEDLRYFVTFLKHQPDVSSMCSHPDVLNGMHSFIYWDLIHRNCAITTDQIQSMLVFLSITHATRSLLSGTMKGELVSETLKSIYYSVQESKAIKISSQGV